MYKRILSIIIILLLTVPLSACKKEVKDKEMTLTCFSKKHEGTYSGTLVDGIPNGNGKFVLKDYDDSFEGNFSNGNITNGSYYENGSLYYSGKFLNGSFTSGNLHNKKGAVVYTGKFENNMPAYNEVLSQAPEAPYDGSVFVKGNLGNVYHGYTNVYSVEATKTDGKYAYGGTMQGPTRLSSGPDIWLTYYPKDDDPNFKKTKVEWIGQFIDIIGNGTPEIEVWYMNKLHSLF